MTSYDMRYEQFLNGDCHIDFLTIALQDAARTLQALAKRGNDDGQRLRGNCRLEGAVGDTVGEGAGIQAAGLGRCRSKFVDDGVELSIRSSACRWPHGGRNVGRPVRASSDRYSTEKEPPTGGRRQHSRSGARVNV